MDHQSVEEIYKFRIKTFEQNVIRLQKTENRIVVYRVLTFFGAIVLFIFIAGYNMPLATALAVAGLGIFTVLIKYNLTISKQKQYYQHLKEINLHETECLNGNFSIFPDGKEYLNSEHPYTGDLDIFGKASLFQLLNRTTSEPGNEKLAAWLENPADIDEILLRQEAIKELSHKVDFRQNLLAVGYEHPKAKSLNENIINWAKQEPLFAHFKFIKPFIDLLSIIIVSVVVLLFFGLSPVYLTIAIIINLFAAGWFNKKINKIHREVSNTVGWLMAYSSIIELTEKETFSSQKLKELQLRFTGTENGASGQLKIISGLVNKLDYRLNIIAGFVLNLLLIWDIRIVLQLERWKNKNRTFIIQWFDAMAEFEALSSLATLKFNNPVWVYPVLSSDYFRFKAEELGHPLITEKKRVTNNISITGTGKLILITGSNMSGKSTFLRTCGINIVLAMAGAPVCGAYFEISPVKVLTSMRINDSLEENTSSFYAELKRLSSIIKSVENNEKVFLLLDEILRGTNSNDRHIGSEALIKQFLANKAVGILATHDLALASLKEEYSEGIENFNFDVKIKDDELYFDYLLNKGICKSMNASLLMKKMGIHFF